MMRQVDSVIAADVTKRSQRNAYTHDVMIELFTIFAGWRMDRADVRDELRARKAFRVLYFLIRFVAPAAIVLIFLTNLFL